MSEERRAIVWESRTMANDYHAHRKMVIEAMVPSHGLQPGARVHDFGCGDGSFLKRFLDVGCAVIGNDVSPGMVEVARESLSSSHRFDPSRIQLGSIRRLSELASSSIDGLLALNVLAYLLDGDEHEFYRQARRVVKTGGWILISHSNMLFGLFTLNRYTVAFLIDNLLLDPSYAGKISGRVEQRDLPTDDKWPPLRLRENPLSYHFKLENYGFQAVRQEFINRDEAPPSQLDRTLFPDTLGLPESERWKLLFTCSTFASLGVRG